MAVPSYLVAPGQASTLRPLDGITVLTLEHAIAAPFATRQLADLGARVIKIENSTTGDYARGWGPPFIEGAAALFHAMNNGKQSIRADFNDKECIARVRAFILEHADVVIQNLKPGNLESHGLGAQALTAEQPSLIYCNLGAFGANGPLRDKPGYDPLAQAYRPSLPRLLTR
jgi:crotonobetainyl-CoA:carnitine CoA-transferase CaiB-like acyl-CoA transferase